MSLISSNPCRGGEFIRGYPRSPLLKTTHLKGELTFDDSFLDSGVVRFSPAALSLHALAFLQLLNPMKCVCLMGLVACCSSHCPRTVSVKLWGQRCWRKHCLSTEQFPVSAYVKSSKNLKDLKDLKDLQDHSMCLKRPSGALTPKGHHHERKNISRQWPVANTLLP